MKRIAFLFFSTFLLFSCGKNQPGVSYNNDHSVTLTIQEVPGVNPPTFIDMTSIADSVRLVKLETTEQSSIAAINELFFTNQWIIVVDARNKTILFFDPDGIYSHKINKIGQGPGEYVDISRVMVDEKRKMIMVYDINQRRLLQYDFDGNELNTIQHFSNDALARDLILLEDGRFLCYRQDNLNEYNGKDKAGLWTVLPDGRIEKQLYSIDGIYPFLFSENWYHLSVLPGGDISFVDQNSTRVRFIHDDSVCERVEFKLPGKTVIDFQGVVHCEEPFFMIMSNQEKGGYIFTDWASDKNDGFMTVVSKHDFSMQVGLTFNPIMNTYFIPGGRTVRNNSYNIHSSWLMPSRLLPYLGEQVPALIRTVAQQQLSGMSETDIENANPILQLIYIKD